MNFNFKTTYVQEAGLVTISYERDELNLLFKFQILKAKILNSRKGF